MKKSKLLTGLGLLVFSALFATSCSGYVKASGDVVFEYNGVKYTADDLFNNDKSVSGAEAKFNAVYRILVRQYFKGDSQTVKDLQTEVEKETKIKIQGQKNVASSNADKNGTSYDTEWEKILDSNNVDDEQGLYDKFEYEIQKEKFEEQFYKDKLDTLRDGGNLFGDQGQESETFGGYLKEKQPYHIKQILVKISGAKDKDATKVQITEAEAQKLYNVITELANGESFSAVAKRYSDDTGSSGDKLGDLGIMDRDTSYVNDFKLGVYLYESYFGSSTSTDTGETGFESKVAKTELGLNDTTSETAGYYSNLVATLSDPSSLSTGGNEGLGQIPYEAVLKLGKKTGTTVATDPEQTVAGYGDLTYSERGFDKIADVPDNANYYPRNVIFNKYFNKHNIMVITPRSLATIDSDEIKKDTTGYISSDGKTRITDVEDYDGVGSDETTNEPDAARAKVYESYSGFSTDTKKNNDDIIDFDSTPVLRDTNGRVILVFRSGNGSGDGSYQGIHFVVIERSPFIGREYESGETKEGVSLSDYYTYYYPDQVGGDHPTYTKEGSEKYGQNKTTYVSYFKTYETSERASRANDVKSKIKSYNSNLNTYIYRYLIKNGSISFKSYEGRENLEDTINTWIDMKRESTKYDADKSWVETWKTYYNSLNVQNKLREPVKIAENNYIKGTISEACAIAWAEWDSVTNKADIAAAFGTGGVWHD